MTPLTAAQVAKARRGWNAVLEIESPHTQALAVAFWAARWAEPLLERVEQIMQANAAKVPPPRPSQDPDT